LEAQPAQDIRVFVIWEPVLPTDLFAPSTASLKRISDPRAAQYWDKERLVSHSLGETDRASVVWDFVAVYDPGKRWEQAPPKPAYSGGPVVNVVGDTRTALRQVLQVKANQNSPGDIEK
jgi:hypothetical protein